MLGTRRRRLVRIPATLLLAGLVGLACRADEAGLAGGISGNDRRRVDSAAPSRAMHWQGEMAGEVSQHSVILRARPAFKESAIFGDIKGRAGTAAFLLSDDEDFKEASRTAWVQASPQNDYIVKVRVEGLDSGTRYYYRLLTGPDPSSTQPGPVGTFRTLDEEGVARETRIVVVTSMHRYSFRATALRDLALRERMLGFPSLEAILSRDPDYFVSTGDSVYYDSPSLGRAKTRKAMRAKWHKQFATPRFRALFLKVPTYWMKDDHDFRYNDADPYGPVEPSPELGAQVFLEQVPLADPLAQDPVTYRSHRISDLLQVWLLEGRDYRDRNGMPPGPHKTMWGADQKAWLQGTLLSSDATFKIIISPTPLVGPDDAWTGVQGGVLAPLFGGNPLGQEGDARKRDNHTNPFGFRAEAEAFFGWLLDNDFQTENVYFVCGDRHWQYHSVHSTGFEEFSVGALVDGSSRLGPHPGDEGSTDPHGIISQPYQQDRPFGGFLEMEFYAAAEGRPATAAFTFYDKHGMPHYRVERVAR